jgi:hypothetical protein
MLKPGFCQFIFLVILLGSCKKDPPAAINPQPNAPLQLPPATQVGNNTFGCILNGKVWLPWNGTNPPTQVTYINHKLAITAWNMRTYGGGIFYLSCSNITKDTSIVISNDNANNQNQLFAYYNYVPVHGCQGLFTLSRFDTINHIYSGTFSFDAIDTAYAETIHVTSGRFDLN